MNNTKLKKDAVKTFFREFALITVCTLIMAIGVYFFKFPNNFTFGGITGFASIFAKILPISAGDFTFLSNMLLLLIGLVFLGKKFAAKTAYASILLSVAISAFERLVPLSGPLTDQPLLELTFAIVLPAFGSAVLFNIGSSSGGTDIIAMLMKKYSNFDIGIALFISDLVAVIASFFLFDVQSGLFSLFGLVIKSILVDTMIENLNLHKYFNVVCTKPDPICDYIVHELNRSATICDATGAFSGSQKYIIFTVMSRTEAVRLRTYIRQCDPQAFILITNTSQIIGRGFHTI